MKLKWLLILPISFGALAGCSDNDDWGAFDRFKSLDVAGKPVDCDGLVSTRSNYNVGSNELTRPLVDYLYESKYEFTQCGTEIRQYLDEYCRTHLEGAVSSYTDQTSGNEPGLIYSNQCWTHITEEFEHVDSRYDLPPVDGALLVLHDAGKMINPEGINEITFKEVFSNRLWRIELHMDDDWIPLYFGDKDKWKKSKSDFAKLAAMSNDPST